MYAAKFLLEFEISCWTKLAIRLQCLALSEKAERTLITFQLIRPKSTNVTITATVAVGP